MTITSRNPATGETLATYAPHSAEEVEARVARAAERAPLWAVLPVAQRARILAALGALLEQEKERLGRLMTLEMGKTLRSGVEEAAKCALGCRYYAENAERFLTPESVERGPDGFGEVRFHPLGVVLAIMPWNFPFWQVIRFAAPALVAGNVGLLKHASNVPQCALAIEELFTRAGFPPAGRWPDQTAAISSDPARSKRWRIRSSEASCWARSSLATQSSATTT